jgi:ABC-type multidrug transport system ATPase subunit
MTSIVVSDVSFSHCDSVPLIAELNLVLDRGWTGVVGPNGSGKTTLLELLAGEREPDSGEIRLHPPDLSRTLCPQTLDRCTLEVVRLGRARRGEAQRLRGELALSVSGLARWESLSPGERKRWQVGAALLGEPDMLILDEPTNHLDGEARGRLIAALRGFCGVGIAVSHDRSLLDALTTQTIRFDRGAIRCWRGGYGAARADWQRQEREELEGYQRLQVEKKKLKRRLAETRRKRDVAESRMRTSKRMKGAQDSDARGRFKAKRRRSAEVSLGWEVHKLRGQLSRLAEGMGGFDLHKALGRSLAVDWVPAPVPGLMSLDLAELRAGDQILVRDVHVQVRARTGRAREPHPHRRSQRCGEDDAGETSDGRAPRGRFARSIPAPGAGPCAGAGAARRAASERPRGPGSRPLHRGGAGCRPRCPAGLGSAVAG